VLARRELEWLDPDEKGILLGLSIVEDGECAIVRLDEKRRNICSKAWSVLGQEGGGARAEILAGWRQEAESGLSDDVHALDPSWIEACVEGESQAIGRAVRELDMRPNRELERAAFAWLAPLWQRTIGPRAEALCNLPASDLIVEVKRLGATVVGRSLAGAPRELRARAMAAAGEPWAQAIGDASGSAISESERHSARAIAMAALTADSKEDCLISIGLAALRLDLPLDGPGSIFRVAGRLPARLGRRLIGW